MAENYIQAYIDSAKMCMESMFGIMCNIEGEVFTQKNTYIPLNELTVNIPFSGAISGDYFMSIKEEEWATYLTSVLGDGSTEMINSCMKELLNTIVGECIQLIQEDHSDLTFLSPRIYRGQIDYPETMTLTSTLSAEGFSSIDISLCLNLMKQDIGLKLDEAMEETALEKAKAEKAQIAIHSIMNNIRQGIFNLDLNGIISPGCSKELTTLFHKSLDEIEEKHFDEACTDSLIRKQKGQMQNWLDFIKNAPESMDWDDICELAPFHEKEFTHNEETFIYQFLYYKVPQEEMAIMIVIEDISVQKQAEKTLTEARAKYESNMELLNTILGLNNSEMFSFLNECDSMLNEIEILGQDSTVDPNTLNHLFRSVHSLKGGAATLNFKELSNAAHKVEDYLDELRQESDNSSNAVSIKENIVHVKHELNNIYTLLNRLNIKNATDVVENSQKIMIDSNDLLELQNQIDQLSKKEIKEALENLQLIPLKSYEPTLKSMIEDLSKQLGKKVAFIIETDCHLPAELFHRLSNPLIHLIRNSLDHGIEMPEVREQAKKNAIATVSLTAQKSDQGYVITLSDDGHGIQTDRLQEVAIAKGVLAKDHKISTKELEMLVFHPGLSTKKGVSNISGRGVGLDSVKATIEDLGGKILINNKPKKGLSFKISLPNQILTDIDAALT